MKDCWAHKIAFRRCLPLFAMVCVVLFASISTVSAKGANNGDSVALNWHSKASVSQNVIQHSEAVPQKQAAGSSALHAQTAQGNEIKTIPYWTSSFDFGGQSYSYSMVGTDPAKGSGISVVPTLLVPVKLVYPNGVVYNGEDKVSDVLNSPIFRFSQFENDYTQYADAIQRAEFSKYISTSSPFYHVWLTPPTVMPTLTINVSAKQGGLITRPSGTVFGGIDVNYLDSQISTYIAQEHLSPQTFPIFLSANVLGTDQQGTSCCIGGYHSANPNADNTAIQTYAYASYIDAGFSVKEPKVFTTTDSLSHEIAEWANDPFTNNQVPYWSVPSESQYGCNNSLEVGDPLVGIGFDLNGYHLQDEAFYSWFAHQSPSIGYDGRYSYLGTFTTPAQTCTPSS